MALVRAAAAQNGICLSDMNGHAFTAWGAKVWGFQPYTSLRRPHRFPL
jgi:hypothetical protein